MNFRLFILIFIFYLVSFKGDQKYKDGHYSGISRAGYTDEPYYGRVKIDIDSGKIVRIVFTIRDSSKHVYFDGNYEKFFTGNDLYIQQCRTDWKGVKSYPDTLLKYQDLDRIDVISGATWSYNIFRAAVRQALKGN